MFNHTSSLVSTIAILYYYFPTVQILFAPNLNIIHLLPVRSASLLNSIRNSHHHIFSLVIYDLFYLYAQIDSTSFSLLFALDLPLFSVFFGPPNLSPSLSNLGVKFFYNITFQMPVFYSGQWSITIIRCQHSIG